MSKSSDQIVLERRLKPIYDAIDLGNNKKAIQEAEKVLKKHPTTHCAKALKALALIRTDRHSEAWPLIDEVEVDTEELDDNTLQALCHCFKEAYTPERICAMYERVCAVNAHHEPSMTHLFLSYVRARNYKQQQKTALALHKEFPRNPYYFWHVMSIVMQATSTEEKDSRSMLFRLAERMVRKMIDSNSIQAEAECELYALILEGEGKFEEAAHFLETDPVYRKFMQQPLQFIFYRILMLHQKANNHNLVIDRAISELKNAADDWNLWTYLFDSAFEQMKMEAHLPGAKSSLIDRLVDRVVSLVDRCSVSKDNCVRGPYLARLTLISRLLEGELELRTQLGTLGLGEPRDHLVEYVRLFQGKPCCFVDIRPFLGLLGEGDIDKFIQEIAIIVEDTRLQYAPTDDDVVPEVVKWADIIYHRLRRALGYHKNLSALEKRMLAAEMIPKILGSSDSFTIAAAYAQISAHLLWDVWTEQGDIRALYEMILLMEWIHSVHSYDPLCRLVLCRAYAAIGAVAPVQLQMQSLDIKYVQRDTLGYLMFGLLEQCGRFNAGIIYYTQLTVLYDQTEKEFCECLTTAYKGGNFTQIPRLVLFLNQISSSVVATGADIQSRLLSACFAVEKIEHVADTLYGDEQPIDFAAVKDNRDFTVIPPLESQEYEKLIEAEKKRSFYEQVDSLHLMHMLLKCVASIGRAQVSSLKLSTQLTQFKKHLEHCRNEYKLDALPSMLLQAPPPLYLKSLVHGGYLDALESLLECAVELVRFGEDTETPLVKKAPVDEDKLKKILPIPEAFAETLMGPLSFKTSSIGPFGLHPLLRHCSNALQTLSLTSIAMKLMEILVERIISGSVTHKSKKGAKKHAAVQRMGELRARVNEAALAVDELLAKGDTMINSDVLIPEFFEDYHEEMARVLLLQKAKVDSGIVTSYASSIADMRQIVKTVIKPPWL